MSATTNHAAHLRGGLVGACSALTATVAHTAAVGAPPASSLLVLLVMVCTALGAAAGGFTAETRTARTVLLIGALAAGQTLGHLALSVAGGAHHHSAALLPLPMLGLHVAAAIGLGMLIGAVEYLYVVCASVLSWLRVFTACRIRPQVHAVWWPSNVIVARPVLLRTGLGMRAPPAVSSMSA